jgi:hypothetical protein
MTQRLKRSTRYNSKIDLQLRERDSFDNNDAWKSIRENIKTLAKDTVVYHRLKHSKTWFD